MDKRTAVAWITERAETEISSDDRARFVEVIETELGSQHEGNFARYQLRSSGFRNWKKGVDQSIEDAFYWYSRAAVQGKIESLTAIRSLYQRDVPPLQKELRTTHDQDQSKITSPAPFEVSRKGGLVSYSDGTVVDTVYNLIWVAKDSERDMN